MSTMGFNNKNLFHLHLKISDNLMQKMLINNKNSNKIINSINYNNNKNNNNSSNNNFNSQNSFTLLLKIHNKVSK